MRLEIVTPWVEDAERSIKDLEDALGGDVDRPATAGEIRQVLRALGEVAKLLRWTVESVETRR